MLSVGEDLSTKGVSLHVDDLLGCTLLQQRNKGPRDKMRPCDIHLETALKLIPGPLSN